MMKSELGLEEVSLGVICPLSSQKMASKQSIDGIFCCSSHPDERDGLSAPSPPPFLMSSPARVKIFLLPSFYLTLLLLASPVPPAAPGYCLAQPEVWPLDWCLCVRDWMFTLHLCCLMAKERKKQDYFSLPVYLSS